MNISHFIQKKIFRIIKYSSKKIKQNSYIVGGYVRDLFLKNNIVKSNDLDILTVGKGIKLAKEVSKIAFNKKSNGKYYYPTIRIFKRYGTAMLEYENKKIEFVGSRKESYKYNSSKPIVEIGTLKDDQNRRDFTINTLAISLNDYDYGKLIDPFDGLSDLRKKIIRTPLNSDITFSDDPLRMMRAIRFATQLKFFIEDNSFRSIKKNKNRIKIVSKERITEEFNKILLSDNPSIGLILLYKSGLLKIILPEVTILEGIEIKDGFQHKNNFYHTLKVVDNISKKFYKSSLWLRWVALLHDIGKPNSKKFSYKIGWYFHDHEYIGSKMIPKIFNRFRLPKGNIIKYVIKIIKYSYRPAALTGNRISDSAIRRLLFDLGNDLEDLIKLCLADITTNNTEKKKEYKKNILYLMKRIKELEKKDRIINWKSPISGYDIMNTFYITPCNKIKVIKDYIKDSILDGKIKNNFYSAYSLMIKKGKDLGLRKK